MRVTEYIRKYSVCHTVNLAIVNNSVVKVFGHVMSHMSLERIHDTRNSRNVIQV